MVLTLKCKVLIFKTCCFIRNLRTTACMTIWGYFISYLGLFLSVGWIFIFRLYTKVEVLWTPKMRGAQCFKPVPRDFDRAHILTFKFSRNCFSNHVGYRIWCLTSTTWQVNDKCIMCMRAAFNFGMWGRLADPLHVEFYPNRFKGYADPESRKSPFSIDLRYRSRTITWLYTVNALLVDES